ncbi:aldehyde dehydrogenase family protein [Kibdelosporangium philippinense]|uniref:Aldehyde dehydrogenase family protein n=1 Tax=Kibdelosporangium philippinense TaxID=211113 RepID=A0ABS8Z4W4_9PSEU|nr:aldehyde dehydrogenase family protein [Kibdelosporangium philippinense]MCE7001623.1 aldehyde dehydrogenase family protein [Kibdelosporangium philippinense]
MTIEETSVSETETTSAIHYGHFVGGDWRATADGTTFEVHEPYTGKVFGEVAACGQAEAKAAIEAASVAFQGWAELAPARKAALFLRAAEIVERRRERIADLLARETGCTVFFANFQQDLVKQTLQHAASWVYQRKGDILQSDVPGTYSTAVRRPLGVVASFTPWNGASVLAWRAVLQPIAAGNTVVVKPSELAPVSAGLIVAEIAAEAGFPPGVVNVVTHAPGEAKVIADEFFENPEVRCINFIGSVQTARMLSERAGRVLKRTVMELGGYNPMIVLEDVDIDYAVRCATFSAFFHQGQICMNARKILVQRGIYDEFLRRFVEKTKTLRRGDPQNPETVIGPLITPQALASVKERVAEAIELGGKALTGGNHQGQVYEPTILVDVPPEATVCNEETFGPVTIVQPVDTVEEAIAQANRTMYGLTSAILTGDTYRGFELAAQVKSGAVHVNMPTIDDEIQAPIGGVRDSGWGRTGPYSIDDFTDLIWVNVQSGQRKLPIA